MSVEKTNDKLELRERIINAATVLFQQHGIKQVRMDDVASKLGISKKTLYGAFADKEAILLEVVKLTSAAFCEAIRSTLLQSTNVVEQIFLFYKRVIEHSRKVNPLFFTELMRYSELGAYFNRMHTEHFGYVKEWLQEGVKQGLLRNDIDYDVFLQQYGFQIDKLLRNPSVRNFPAEVIYNSVVLVLLRGMATDKGLEIIKNLK
jgi:AcrR family transcriptional regulator